MKKLLLSLITLTLLFGCSLPAKNATQKEQYKVEIITEESNKKGIFGNTIYIKVRDFVLVVIESAAANKVAQEVQNYVNDYGLDKEKVALKFNGKLKVSLLEDFSPQKYQYNKFENVSVNYSLRQKAYTYLISVERDEACLLYPNSTATNSILEQGAYSLGGYAFNATGNVKLHLVSSLNVIDFSKFDPNGIYRCTTRGKGIQKVANIKNHHTNDVLRQDIFIK
ncbi:MAG: Unknown protein [uncultured Sulfurovum sp.]|uniref:Lipoprotein n=1 Tax=uncultured Sulfurovum sp. TaxID=269237 RepID=A0A6S6UCZ9_9BACT|nr:MAG: Unknown protein [uncultured Sulfurovum sp.]